MLLLYKIVTTLSSPFLQALLHWRVLKGKEDKARLKERTGKASAPRPTGQLIWLHAASVGEAQSALILIGRLSAVSPNFNFLVTSGTKTSATLMANRLPQNAVHQYVPLDHPCWTARFLKHWQPDLILWMESELWPNMLEQIQSRKIPAILINARLSDRSYKRWKIFRNSARKLLSSFSLILAQTKKDQARFLDLSASTVNVIDNLKYSAAPLPVNAEDLKALKNVVKDRPLWVYASTHDGEETLATRLHTTLKENHPDLLTIIVPRHPERRHTIQHTLETMGLNITMRGNSKKPPTHDTDIYVVDTLGELGLFYTLSPIAMIGRSFSHDGGGGHNPIEAAQLSCAVLTGPNVQYQTQLFEDMKKYNAVTQVMNEGALLAKLKVYLSDQNALDTAIANAEKFAKDKAHIIDDVMAYIAPYLSAEDK